MLFLTTEKSFLKNKSWFSSFYTHLILYYKFLTVSRVYFLFAFTGLEEFFLKKLTLIVVIGKVF